MWLHQTKTKALFTSKLSLAMVVVDGGEVSLENDNIVYLLLKSWIRLVYCSLKY